ncbi:hypothetical protein KAR91_51575 [Candidatus Pacearchaeota archaeon]|nr:hypothetical protein [Candidatus Pacearchaeota archaeon]
MTKEELLLKGISEEDADRIVAALDEGSEEESPLQSLQKALESDPAMDDLHKATGGDADSDEEDDKDYNPDYMKKYMKRYMKENKKSCQKMMANVDESGEKMNKAIEDIDPNYDGAVVEMTELKPFLDSMKDVVGTMTKAISELNGRVDVVSSQVGQSHDLMKKAAQLQVDQAESFKGVDKFLSGSQGTRGVVATANMQKATPADQSNRQVIHSALMKAVKAGDEKAGKVISVFESCGQDINRLGAVHKEYIVELIGEAK